MPASSAAPPVRYRLTPRLMPEGRVGIILRLYRDDEVSESLLAVVEWKEVPEVMLKCHQHLARLGVGGTREAAPPLKCARAMTSTPGVSLPP